MLEPITIMGTNLPDVWHQTLFKAIEIGRDFKIDRGSNAEQWRKEFDYITIHANCPGKGELLPKLNPALKLDDPCAQNFLDNYMPYLMTGEDEEGKSKESYTYGKRICKDLLDVSFLRRIDPEEEKILVKEKEIWENPNIIVHEPSIDSTFASFYVNQMELMIWTYKNRGYRNNQMIMQVAKPTDMLLQDPPCLRHIDTRIQSNQGKELIKVKQLFLEVTGKTLSNNITLDNAKNRVSLVLGEADAYSQKGIDEFLKKCEVPELHFMPYFRSWDLWGGLPANLAAIELMKQYCSKEIGVENGEIIASSKGLHLYNYVWEIAEIVRGKTSAEFKKEFGI